jgi:HAE1 family hydrophobic/amphiphilic exporter-1
MVFTALTLVGAFAYTRLAVDLFPELDFPSISVVATYPGVSPEEIETLLTRPIEAAVSRVEGIERLESYSAEGRSRVALRFDWGVPLEEALNDVRAAVESARAQFPDDADPPVVYKFDLTNLPVMYIGLSGGMDEARMRSFAEDVAQPFLERSSGVASVEIRGAREREIRVALDAERAAALGISPGAVVSALGAAGLTVPAGRVDEGEEHVLVRAMSEFESLEDVSDAVVAWRGGEVIRVRDIADVVDGFEEVSSLVRVNGVPGVLLTVSKTPGANTIDVADGLLETVERFNVDYAGAAEMRVLVDSSTFIRRSIAGVQDSVVAGAVLALVVLLLFLQSVRSTLVIGVAIPISVIATFMLMYQLDLSLNLISFGGLALGIGMLVDNAIVILENIFRHRENGVPAFEAAVKGAEEVGSAIIASTLTTLAVFAPVVFVGGFGAVFFGQMALVVTSALICSLFVALTLVPVLSSKLLRGENVGRAGIPAISRVLDGLDNLYSRVVGIALRHGLVVVVVSIAALVGVLQLTDRVGSELLPEADESEVRINAFYPSGTLIEVTDEAARRVERIVREHAPEATDVQVTLGAPGFWSTRGEESASFRVNLVPVEQRERSSAEVAQALRPHLERELPGMRVSTRAGGGLWIFNFLRGGDDRIRLDILGHDLETADRLAREVLALASEVPGVADMQPSREKGGRESRLYVDRDKAGALGLSTRDVAGAISVLVQGQDAAVFRERGDEFRIRVRLSEEDLESMDSLLARPIVLPGGVSVPLGDLVRVEPGETPQAIDRLNQRRIVVVSGGVEDGYELSDVVSGIRSAISDLEVPEGFSVIIAGESAEQQSTFQSLGVGIFLAILLVYMVMAGQFESFLQPLVIMASVPFAAIGVVLTLLLTDTTFNINSFLGVVVLVGVVVNNAIVLVDYINLLRRTEGLELRAAVVEGARRRLRPILMTTLTTTLALVPVAMASSTGGESQAPLARVVIGGMISSTVITLFIVPILYTWLESAKRRLTT